MNGKPFASNSPTQSNLQLEVLEGMEKEKRKGVKREENVGLYIPRRTWNCLPRKGLYRTATGR